ncbi:MAG: hypothetical protein ACI8RZ_005034 [Myxococcota bacterium]|jgi:uncharacterized protein (TIGR00661 family)
MNILYGVVGEGMGHATRSRVVLEHLLAAGHRVLVVVSGRAHGFLTRSFADRTGIEIEEIQGLHLVYEEDGVDRSESLRENLRAAPSRLKANLNTYASVVGRFSPDVVVSDFESWAYLFARTHDLPVVSVDNMQIINRCRHTAAISDSRSFNFLLSKLAVKSKLPDAYHYLVSTFFFPPVHKKRTTLLPPILRPEILAAQREIGSHILVYQTASTNEALVPTLKALPHEFRVYGMDRDERDGNVHLRPFSQDGFIDDLRTARAVIAGGGFSLMSEAVHLQVPMLTVPLKDQYEQELNARYLHSLGYGRFSEDLAPQTISDFLDNIDAHQQALSGYIPRDNTMLLGCLDEVIRSAALGEPPPDTLIHDNLGDAVSSRIDAALSEPDETPVVNDLQQTLA